MTSLSNKSNRYKIIKDNSDPAKGISLVIPRVFNNIGWRRIKQIFISLGWGFVERVDVTPDGRIPKGRYKRAFVHFAPGKWNTRNPEAMAVLDALRNGQLVNIIYDEPWFWKVGISGSKKPTDAPPRPKSRPEVVTESKPTSSGESKKNNTNKNTRRERRRKERANAAQKRLNNTRKQNAGRRKKHKTRRRRRKKKK